MSRTACLLLALLATTGCAASPRPLTANEDACDFCRMTVVDVRTGGEALGASGRLHTFDSIACLTGFLRSGPAGEPRGVWVADYATGRMVPVDSAVFLRGSSIRSSMGPAGDLVAFAPGVPEPTLVARYGGAAIAWREVLATAGNDASAPGATPRDGDTSASPPSR